MIPELDQATGMLPLGRHVGNADEVRDRFVRPFSTSNRRRPKYEDWRKRRRAIAHFIPIEMEWVGGSFVSAKVEPDDIDCAVFLDAAAFGSLPPMVRAEVERCARGESFDRPYECDGKIVPVRPEGHPDFHLYTEYRGYVDWLYHRKKDGSGERGFVDVRGEP